MILVVDDEDVYLLAVKHALEQDGREVETFDDPKLALERAGEIDPELIISDVKMPGLDGFDFKKALSRRYPKLDAPFVFLSSLGETDNIVRGLDADADDYLTKPVDPRLLRAKVRTLISKRARRGEDQAYCGDLHVTPFVKVVQFCEAKGFTGDVDFVADDLNLTVPFRGGNLLLDEIDDADAVLEKLYDLDSGSFSIRTASISFDELSGVGVVSSVEPIERPQNWRDRPMGRLSDVKLNDRSFQIQTEMVHHPEVAVLTVVVLNGNTLLKRAVSVPDATGRTEIERLIGEQHGSVEDEVRHKVEDLLTGKVDQSSRERDRYYELYDAGFEKFRAGLIADALALWEEARVLNPEDRTLDINIKVAREKLGTGG